MTKIGSFSGLICINFKIKINEMNKPYPEYRRGARSRRHGCCMPVQSGGISEAEAKPHVFYDANIILFKKNHINKNVGPLVGSLRYLIST